jgi:hypothetical protein
MNVYYAYNYQTGLPTDLSVNLNLFGLTKKQWGIFGGGGTSPGSTYDYYEPRTEGRYSRSAGYWYAYAGFNTNYAKMFAIDVNFNTSNFLKNNIHHFKQEEGYNFTLKPRVRISDKLSFITSLEYNFDPFNPGFANFDSNGDIIYGGRRLDTYVSTLTGKYIFKNDLSLTLNARHYWITGQYRNYYVLQDDGLLAPTTSYSGNDNFNYNAFNIDAVFSWQFSPGSIFSVVYKNAIETGDQHVTIPFGENFNNTLSSPQTNSISLKVLYYLDYQNLKRKKA